MREVVTPASSFGNVSRGWPLPYQFSRRQLRAAGLTAATWRCRIEFDGFLQQHHIKVAAVMRRLPAPAPALFREVSPRIFEFDMAALYEVAHRRGSQRFMKAMQCQNIDSPLGQGLWEGPRLCDVLKELEADARGRIDNVRRLNFSGFHNNDAKQRFRSTLSYTDIFEPEMGTPPVILAYSLNGGAIPVERGGPVRLVVPHAHGFKVRIAGAT